RRDLMELFSTTPGRPAFFAGTFNGHPASAAASLATIDKLQREPVHDHIFSLGDMARAGLRDLYRRLGIAAQVSGFGSVFVTYFLDRQVERYEDLLDHDADLFVGYRSELVSSGVFELPLNLKRSHVSYAHTEADIAALLEGTESAVMAVLHRRERRGVS
ncbi:MAG: hypothetical protein J2O47_09755, partial [Acidimicrobiaceae bacterium]|nr:hypothetical protein [Acidimicrobiaceae bacterium]